PADGAATTAAGTAWTAAEGAACPATHPVKAKLPSRIYHLPGMANYSRTVPDRCYADGDAAEADGFRKAKR
ncbi:MAG: nuclease, partial [Actinomycetota bacterium]|nr:nuclease [Actinomycetota bacterium]